MKREEKGTCSGEDENLGGGNPSLQCHFRLASSSAQLAQKRIIISSKLNKNNLIILWVLLTFHQSYVFNFKIF